MPPKNHLPGGESDTASANALTAIVRSLRMARLERSVGKRSLKAQANMKHAPRYNTIYIRFTAGLLCLPLMISLALLSLDNQIRHVLRSRFIVIELHRK